MMLSNTRRTADLRIRLGHVALWALQILVAVLFLMAGGAKLWGAATMVAMFEKLGLGQWFRVFTGTTEVVGALLLLVPSMVSIGAVVLSVVMMGAVAAQVFILGGSPLPALVLLVCSLGILGARLPRARPGESRAAPDPGRRPAE